MNLFDWQTGLAVALVVLALLMLGRRIVRFLRGGAGACGAGSCGAGCGRKATGEASSQKPLPLSSISFREPREKPQS